MYSKKRMNERRLDTCYIGVVGSGVEHAQCRDSIEHLRIRPGDAVPQHTRATKGYEARQAHINRFYKETEHGYILLMDADQTFPADALERLRTHGLPYVTGYYLRRMYKPIAPVWYEPSRRGEWPAKPYMKEPPRGELIELGASGWGCMLLHREVLDAVAPLLKGEDFVIEDDMDIWPYDLDRLMAARNTLANIDQITNDQVVKAAKIVAEEIVPLSGNKSVIGSDIRFPYYARAAGYKLYGDPDVRCGHVINFPLHPDDYTSAIGQQDNVAKDLNKKITAARRVYRETMGRLSTARVGGEA